MIKAKKMWIAEHPTQPGNREVKFDEPVDDYTYIESNLFDEDGACEYVEWVEYVCIPVE